MRYSSGRGGEVSLTQRYRRLFFFFFFSTSLSFFSLFKISVGRVFRRKKLRTMCVHMCACRFGKSKLTAMKDFFVFPFFFFFSFLTFSVAVVPVGYIGADAVFCAVIAYIAGAPSEEEPPPFPLCLRISLYKNKSVYRVPKPHVIRLEDSKGMRMTCRIKPPVPCSMVEVLPTWVRCVGHAVFCDLSHVAPGLFFSFCFFFLPFFSNNMLRPLGVTLPTLAKRLCKVNSEHVTSHARKRQTPLVVENGFAWPSNSAVVLQQY